ncbi:MAG: transporter [Gammaproteobacteria bacterium]
MNRMTSILTTAVAVAGVTLSLPINAHENTALAPVFADSHAPVGVMADHTHNADEWMLSYRFRHMRMDGNRIDDTPISPDEIVTNVPNRFAGLPMQPPTLRVVPLEMTMDMHMFGAMYAPTDRLTLMAMSMYMEKAMTHRTYMGPAGTTALGTFETRSRGFGDTGITAMFNIHENNTHRIQINTGISMPTGSITETGSILTPMNTRPVVRLPYAMQLGSGTWDLKAGAVYAGRRDRWGWGAQYAGTFRLDTNDEGYNLGDRHLMTSWVSYRWTDWLSTSVRIEGETTGRIEGMDSLIMGPVQTADPDNYGGDTVTALLGFNLAGQSGWLRNHRIALEAGLPLYRNLNGPQMKTDLSIQIGWQYAF